MPIQESSEDFGEQDEDTEIQKLPLYTERKAEGIYRYRRRVPKNLVERVGKGYLYRNLGRTKKDVVGNWPDAWTCHGLVPLQVLSYAAIRSKAKGLFQPNAECLRRGL